jgi:branched-subunit amino acid transport protein
MPSTPVVAVAAHRRRADWMRLGLVEALQIPTLFLVIISPSPAAPWCAAIWGSGVCCAGTDSHWRWRNRLLIAQAIAWLLQALLR